MEQKYVIDVYHEAGQENTLVSMNGKALALVPTERIEYPVEQTALEWSVGHCAVQIAKSVVNIAVAMIYEGTFVYPDPSLSAPYHLRVALEKETEQVALLMVEEAYYFTRERQDEKLSVHLGTILGPDSTHFVTFKRPSGSTLSVPHWMFEVWRESYQLDTPAKSLVERELLPAFEEAQDYLVESFCESLPDWFDLTDYERVHAQEAAFGKALSIFLENPVLFWTQHGQAGLVLMQVEGIGTKDGVGEFFRVSTVTPETPASGARVLAVLHGGLVQDVYSNVPVEVLIIDRDIEGADEDEISRPEDIDTLVSDTTWRLVGCDRYLVDQPVDLVCGKEGFFNE